MPVRRRWPKVLAVIAVLLLALVLLWDWDWFRPLVERQASQATGRKVRLAHLRVHLLARSPQIALEGLALANPEGFPAGSDTASIERLALRIEPRALLHRRVRLLSVEIDHPVGELGPGADGTPNWTLHPPPSSGAPPAQPWQVDVGSLAIRDGHVHFLDPKLKSDFQLEVHTQEAAGGGEPSIYVGVQGRYAGQPIEGRFIGGSVLSLRNPDDRYPVDLKLANGATQVSLQGTLLEPLKFGGADLKLELAGDDLANLYPLTGVPLAPTPPYRLAGQLDYEGGKIRFRDFAGTVGSSDLNGWIQLQRGGVRPYIEADLYSRKVVLADLRGFIGAAPGKPEAEQLSAEQQKEHARQEASGKLLPDTPLNLPKIRAADFSLHYKGQRIESESTPLDNLETQLSLEGGVITLKPLSFGVGQGAIVLNLRLDGTQQPAKVAGDVDFRRLDVSHIMSKTSVFKGAGTIGGSARIDTSGESLAQMLGRGNGELKLFMSGGNLSALLVDLAGLDFGNGVLSALGVPSRAQLRCMVTDFGLQQGVLDTRTFVIDTTEANITGAGKVDLAREQVDYRLETEPKHFNIGSLPAPILIRGPLKKPGILPDPVSLAERGGAAVVLGVLLTPLAALLPTIQLGLGKDHDCGTLMSSVQTAADKAKAAPPRTKAVPVPKADADHGRDRSR
jgi:uncharacterized protein involved in outer membrane biogenesis